MLEFYIRLYKFILSRRYRVHLLGADILKLPGPKIILPNHISHIDPQLISIITHEYTDFVPLVAERFFKVPVVKYFLRHLYAVKVPDLKKGRENVELMRSINSDLLNVLKNNKSVVIFPAGQLSSGGIERIHNKQSAFSLVASSSENIRIIGVRVRGMWGSMWSKAWNGKRPVFLKTYLLNIVLFFANLIFLCPKRNVFFTFVDITREARIKAQTDRKNFNLFLEEFYNEAGPEPPTFIRHLFFFPRIKNKLPEVYE